MLSLHKILLFSYIAHLDFLNFAFRFFNCMPMGLFLGDNPRRPRDHLVVWLLWRWMSLAIWCLIPWRLFFHVFCPFKKINLGRQADSTLFLHLGQNCKQKEIILRVKKNDKLSSIKWKIRPQQMKSLRTLIFCSENGLFSDAETASRGPVHCHLNVKCPITLPRNRLTVGAFVLSW